MTNHHEGDVLGWGIVLLGLCYLVLFVVVAILSFPYHLYKNLSSKF